MPLFKDNKFFSDISNFKDRIGSFFKPKPRKLKSALPIPESIPTPTPTPYPLWRNPEMERFIKQEPKSFEEIKSGVTLATEDPVKRQIMMDLALEESSLRTHPPVNPKSTAKGPFQFLDDTATFAKLNDVYNATESAKATSKLMDLRHLNWWETWNKPGATKTPVSTLYSDEEVEKYLPKI